MDVLRALAICGGAARRPALARLGVDDAALRRAVRAGVLQPDRGFPVLSMYSTDAVKPSRARSATPACSWSRIHTGLLLPSATCSSTR